MSFGPGEIYRGHSPDEMPPVAEFGPAMTWVAQFIADYCGVERRAWGR